VSLWTPQIGLVLALLLPLVGAGAILALAKRPNLRDGATLVTAALLLANIVPLVIMVGEGARPSLSFGQIAPGLEIALSLEPLGALFAGTASVLWILNSLFSIGYIRAHHAHDQTRFYAFFAFAIAATMGVALAGNMLTLFVFYEALTLSTYPLVAHNGDENARRGARIYLLVLLSTSLALLLPAIAITYFAAGSTDFVPGGLLAGAGAGEALIGLLLVLYAFGIGKAALMPAHSWLPNAMVAPTPVSALLHAVAVVKAGVFTMLKVVVYVFGPDAVAGHPVANVLAGIAAISIVLASLIALSQSNLKARLAWSTVSQLSYVTLGAMLATPAALTGAAFQIVMHAFAKITLFMCAGAFTTATHMTEVSDTRGFGRRMPLLFAAFLIAAVSITGLPPLGGMWTKLFLSMGAAESGAVWALVALIVSTLLNVAYLIAIPVRAFLTPAAKDPASYAAPPRLTVLPPALTALATLVLFFLAGPIYDYISPVFGGAQ
jgi:multicomponent Na+:H+ antiporter subunit D